MKKHWSLFLCIYFFITAFLPAYVSAESSPEIRLELSAPSAVLIEPETGTVIYEKDKDTRRSPASITKIMTLLLIFENLDAGKLKPDDIVTTSAYAKSMGGSQVFLEEGETQTVETMIKCIIVASGNDASVAMAEHISGSEEAFVQQMNQKAVSLNMKNTHFTDCCGLTDSDYHYTTAYDISLMSRELITKHPKVLDYSTIWMDNITHVTRKGSKEFVLTNTNKLLRTYKGCVGLKTGSTSKAGFCISAVAKRNGLSLISVVMAAPDYKARLKDAAAMLNYGFERCSLYTDNTPPPLPVIPVKGGIEEKVHLKYKGTFRFLFTDGAPSAIRKKLKLPENISAPVKKNQSAGELVYYSGNRKLGSLPVTFSKSVRKATCQDCILRIWRVFLGNTQASF